MPTSSTTTRAIWYSVPGVSPFRITYWKLPAATGVGGDDDILVGDGDDLVLGGTGTDVVNAVAVDAAEPDDSQDEN